MDNSLVLYSVPSISSDAEPVNEKTNCQGLEHSWERSYGVLEPIPQGHKGRPKYKSFQQIHCYLSSLLFFFRSFIFMYFTCRSLTHFDLIFMKGVRSLSRFSFAWCSVVSSPFVEKTTFSSLQYLCSFNFYYFKCLKLCFMTYNMLCLGVCSTWVWEVCLLNEVVHRCRFYPVAWWLYQVQLSPYWYATCSIYIFLIVEG